MNVIVGAGDVINGPRTGSGVVAVGECRSRIGSQDICKQVWARLMLEALHLHSRCERRSFPQNLFCVKRHRHVRAGWLTIKLWSRNRAEV